VRRRGAQQLFHFANEKTYKNKQEAVCLHTFSEVIRTQPFQERISNIIEYRSRDMRENECSQHPHTPDNSEQKNNVSNHQT
jgi:hypothetical protein